MKKRFVDARIWVRRGTSAQWVEANPVLGPGEMGYDYESGDIRIGNGTDSWSLLPAYLNLVQASGFGSAALKDIGVNDDDVPTNSYVQFLFQDITQGPQGLMGPQGLTGPPGADGLDGPPGSISGPEPFYEGVTVISYSRTLDTSKNWMTIGPIEIAAGVEITVEGSWVIV